ncbi:hypothetical protein G7Y79_00027g060040 [Physcia stellaris]|nr:hypothetical protein G7Y79_00027g060040 [Physcia stellaris]
MTESGQTVSSENVVQRKHLMDFNSFPREIRDQIYKECLVNPRISTSTGNTRDLDIGDIDRHVRRTFGVLDGDTWSHKFADEARAVFYTDNTFTVPCSGLHDFLTTGSTWRRYPKDSRYRPGYLDSLRRTDGATPTKADLKLEIMLSEIQPYSYIRKIAVQLPLELGECGFVWTDRNRDPSQQLRELLNCPKLQEVELLIQGPERIGLGHEVARMIVEIWDVIEALYKRFGDGLKGMNYLLALKAGYLDDSDGDEDAEAGRNSGGFDNDHDHDDRDGGEYGRYGVDEGDETYDYGYDDYT